MRAVFFLFAAISLLQMILPKKYKKIITGLLMLTVISALVQYSVSLDFQWPEIAFPDDETVSELMYSVPVSETVYRLYYEKSGEYPERVDVNVVPDGDTVRIEKIVIYSDCRSVSVLEYLCEQLETDKIYYGDDR